MAYDLTPFELGIGAWLTSCLPAVYLNKIVTTDQRGIALVYPFATFSLIDETPLNCVAAIVLSDTLKPGGATGEYVESVTQTMRGILSVNVYGPSAFADAQRLILEYQRFLRASEASARGFTVAAHSGIRRLSESTGPANEQRAQIDFTLYFKRSIQTANLAVNVIVGQPE